MISNLRRFKQRYDYFDPWTTSYSQLHWICLDFCFFSSMEKKAPRSGTWWIIFICNQFNSTNKYIDYVETNLLRVEVPKLELVSWNEILGSYVRFLVHCKCRFDNRPMTNRLKTSITPFDHRRSFWRRTEEYRLSVRQDYPLDQLFCYIISFTATAIFESAVP